jgi:hypothetical protein
MKIQVTIKSVYGMPKIYPYCETAAKFCKLLGTKTLTEDAVSIIKSIGYSIEVIQDKVTL